MLDYPIKFRPILHEKIWGGSKLKDLLNKETDKEDVGESWEISGVKGNISTVANGPLKGRALTDLVSEYKSDLVGKKIYNEFGNEFPLLIKFIDAKEDLSVQLHPNDKLAVERHDSFGKTEMWYVMQAEPGAKLIVGFNKKMTQEEYVASLESGKITDILNFESVKEGDGFFINEGKIHAIGAGVMLAEIQQTSDITYRVYDWDRVDSEGNSRELHTDLALEALSYEFIDDFKMRYKRKVNEPSNIASCNYFTTNYLSVSGKLKRDLDWLDSFKIYICVKGKGIIKINNNKEDFRVGETVFVPACNKFVELVADSAELLEVYI